MHVVLTTTISLKAVSYKFTNNLHPVSPSTPVVNNLQERVGSSLSSAVRRCGPVPQGRDEGAGAVGEAAQHRLSWLTMAAQRIVKHFPHSGVPLD